MEPGHYKLKRADAFTVMYVYRYTAAVILNPDYVIPFQNDKNGITESLHGFINRVINYFVNQMMKTIDAGGPYVHAWTFADRFQAFKNSDILSRIVGIHYQPLH
jgi:hypothetical protein